MTNCSGRGLSRPYSRMRFWIVSADTRPDRNRSVGSPGARLMIRNDTTLIPIRIGIAWIRRRRTYVAMDAPLVSASARGPAMRVHRGWYDTGGGELPPPRVRLRQDPRSAGSLGSDGPGVRVVVVDADAGQVERLVLGSHSLGQAGVSEVRPREVVRELIVDEVLELGVDLLALGLVELGSTVLKELVGRGVLPAREVVRRRRGLRRDLRAVEDRIVVRIEGRGPPAEVRVEVVRVVEDLRDQDGVQVSFLPPRPRCRIPSAGHERARRRRGAAAGRRGRTGWRTDASCPWRRSPSEPSVQPAASILALAAATSWTYGLTFGLKAHENGGTFARTGTPLPPVATLTVSSWSMHIEKASRRALSA